MAQSGTFGKKRLASFRKQWHHITNVVATPLLGKPSDAHIWRLFLFVERFVPLPIIHRVKYKKPPLTVEEQLALLESRGLVVGNRSSAMRWLSRVNYYRLSAYLHTYRVCGSDTYKSGTTFQEIADLYNFDRKLRIIVMDAIERVEVWFRTAITYELAHHCGPFGYKDKSIFSKGYRHDKLMRTLHDEQRKSKETFIEHYEKKYTAENHLPIWMATELLTFGNLSFMYDAMPLELRRRIALQIDVTENVLSNWMQSMSYVRNLCAHHSRLWNRQLSTSPKIPRKVEPLTGKLTPRKTYVGLVVLAIILDRIAPYSTWKTRLANLIRNNPQIDSHQMGFPVEWDKLFPFGTPPQEKQSTS